MLRLHPTIRHSDPVGRKAASGVWTQGQEVGAQRKYGDKLKRSSSGRGKVLILIVATAILLLLFVPVVAPQSPPPSCLGTSCPAHPTHYVSATNHFLGVGGAYLPPGEDSTPHSFFGTENTGGTVVSGFGVSYYYFAW